jgi:hypothetical protein
MVTAFIAAQRDDIDMERLHAALDGAIGDTVLVIQRELEKRIPSMLADHRRLKADFHGRLRRTWGKALNLHYAVVTASQEFGNNLVKEKPTSPTGDDRAVLGTLADLHAQACRVALEVHALLDNGLPVGAQARARTMHELAVTACVIAENAAETDVTRRYRDHHVVDQAKDAKEYQLHCAALGEEPLDRHEIEKIFARREEVIARYGRAFKGQYGWAAALLDNERPTFADLEQRAGLAHLRPFYRWACHAVHAGSRGTALNTVVFRGESLRLAGYTNAGLADPGHQSLISLQQATASLVGRRTHVPTLDHLVQVRALMALTERAGDEFLRAHQRVDALERRYLARAVADAPDG